jgi:hypothetical protein
MALTVVLGEEQELLVGLVILTLVEAELLVKVLLEVTVQEKDTIMVQAAVALAL